MTYSIAAAGGLALCGFTLIHIHRKRRSLKARNASISIGILHARNQIRAVNVFISALLSKLYGPLTVAQLEFIGQVHKSAREAEKTLNRVVQKDKKRTKDSVQKASEKWESSINPIVHHLVENQDLQTEA